MLDQFERHLAGTLALERHVDDGVRSPSDVHGRGSNGFVHWDRGVAEADDSRAIAKRLGKCRAEYQRDVLDGVMFVNDEVSGRVDGDVEHGVVRQRVQQVVEEADARVDPGLAGSVERDRDRDLGLLRGTVDGCRAIALCHDCADLTHARIPLATSMRRSFSSSDRTVRRRQSASG